MSKIRQHLQWYYSHIEDIYSRRQQTEASWKGWTQIDENKCWLILLFRLSSLCEREGGRFITRFIMEELQASKGFLKGTSCWTIWIVMTNNLVPNILPQIALTGILRLWIHCLCHYIRNLREWRHRRLTVANELRVNMVSKHNCNDPKTIALT